MITPCGQPERRIFHWDKSWTISWHDTLIWDMIRCPWKCVLYSSAVLSIARASASMKRSFSTQGAMHSKTRNRLLRDELRNWKFYSFGSCRLKVRQQNRAWGDTLSVSVEQEEEAEERVENTASQIKRCVMIVKLYFCHEWEYERRVNVSWY